MEVEALLPEAGRLTVERLRIEPLGILLELRCTDAAMPCPSCQSLSERVHSRYVRTLGDLPWRGAPVVIHWKVRRFFCDNPDCQRKVFAEQLPALAAKKGRNSRKLNDTLIDIGLECGGEPGSRLAAELGISTSGDTILRRLRSVPLQPDLHPQAIGIDDFAFRKGHNYGTVIVDHESGHVMDILPERSSDSTADWLATQPQVEVVTRDRSMIFANGITAANPQAVQVADRFHLHVNLREAVVRMLDRHHRDVTTAAKAVASRPLPADESVQTAAPPTVSEGAGSSAPVPSLTKEAERTLARRARRLARYEEIVRLHQSGAGARAIARQMKMGRGTVRKFLRAGVFPERAKTHRRRAVDRYVEELRRLWDSGIHKATELYERIRAQGFQGSSSGVTRYVAHWRDPRQRMHVSGPRPKPRSTKATPIRISSNRLSWLLLKPEIDHDADEKRVIEELLATCAHVRIGTNLAKQFKTALASHQPKELWVWTQQVTQDGVPEELQAFAEGLIRDKKSVEAAVSMKWSNGRAEGHVNRIKLIKRKMYGRANFDLLRIRVLGGS